MPYLNWRSAAIRQEVGSHPKREFTLSLALPAHALEELLSGLEEVFLRGGGAELRVDLPQEWIIFWKEREEESRLLLAHPQQAEWVATAALEKRHAEIIISRLRKLKPGDRAQLSEGGTIGRISNVEIEIVVV